MNENAQNALLKVLEEPPAGVTFILLAKSAKLLLETIRSRCVIFTLSPVSFEDEGINKVFETTATGSVVSFALYNIGVKGNVTDYNAYNEEIALRPYSIFVDANGNEYIDFANSTQDPEAINEYLKYLELHLI